MEGWSDFVSDSRGDLDGCKETRSRKPAPLETAPKVPVNDGGTLQAWVHLTNNDEPGRPHIAFPISLLPPEQPGEGFKGGQMYSAATEGGRGAQSQGLFSNCQS